MPNATKAFAALAIVALAGGALAIDLAGSTDPTTPGTGARTSDAGTIAPAALEGAVMQPRAVSGTITYGAWPDEEPEDLGDGLLAWPDQSVAVSLQASDARLDGSGRLIEHALQHFETVTGLRSSTWELETDGGGWIGAGHGYATDVGGGGFITLSGTGAFDGLSAYIAIRPDATGSDEDETDAFEGVIFPGTMAPPPELPSDG